MSRSQRRWHLLAWAAIVPVAVTVLVLALRQRDAHSRPQLPQLQESPR